MGSYTEDISVHKTLKTEPQAKDILIMSVVRAGEMAVPLEDGKVNDSHL